MRIKIYILISTLIPILMSCGDKYTENPTITRAEQIMLESPDSAYRMLTTIKNPENLSDADYAAWCLHYTHAQYKLYYDITSDSLIKNAVNYYIKTDLNEYSGIAYYLLGCVLEIKRNSKEAMIAYKEADRFLTESTNFNTKGLLKYRIGYLFLSDEYLSESELYIDESITYFKKANNNTYLYYAYRTKAEILYLQNSNLYNTLQVASISESLSLQNKDTTFYMNVQVFKGKVLLQTNTMQAKKYLLIAFNGLPNEQKSTATLLAYAYSKLNMPDSARYYSKYYSLNQLDNNSEFLQKVANAYLSKCEGKQDSAFLYFEEAYNLRENIYKQNIKEQLIRIDKQYDLSKKEAEKATLEITLQRNVIIIALLSIVVLTVLVILLFITNVNKKRRVNYIIEKQKLELEIKTKKAENDKKLTNLILNLQYKIENTLHLKRIQSCLAKTEKKEEFIAEITRQSTLTDKEWKYYIEQANELFDGKIFQLKELYPSLTNSDLIVISLISLGIDLSNCILLLDYGNTNTIYIRRNRIKLHLGLDKTVDLKQWIEDYLQINT